MDKNILYYSNRNKYNNICVPKREGILNYLIKEKFLSEFKTNEEKRSVLDNLGITQELDNLLELIEERITMALLLSKLKEVNLNKDGKSKGYFSSYASLVTAYPSGEVGDWAIVNVGGILYIYRYEPGSGWQQAEIYEVGAADLQELRARVETLENDPTLVQNGIKHKLLSLKEYDKLQSYDKNTLYLIADFSENTSVFGDTFPLILGGEDSDEPSSQFGGTFPLVFGTSNYYIGSRFPITFKN